jgi:hypothetical protein
LHSTRTCGLILRRSDGSGFRFWSDRDFVGHGGWYGLPIWVQTKLLAESSC